MNSFSGCVPLIQLLANFLKGPDSEYFWLCRPYGLCLLLVIQYFHRSMKVATDKHMNGPDCVPITGYLQKQVPG